MKNFILAARPKTLLAGVIPPIVTYFYYLSYKLGPQSRYLLLCVAGALFIQLATNFFNDVIDHKKGADAKRVGPTRVSASGLVEIKIVERWAWACLIIAGAIGVPIIIRGGLPFIVLGTISLYLTFGYTGGKVSLAYRGLGELFVFLFFGLFSVMGSFYLYAQFIAERVAVLAMIYGLLTTTFICVNNLRDRETDKEVGKNTLATRMSESSYRLFTIATIFLPYALILRFHEFNFIAATAFGLIPAFKLTQIVMKEKGAALNEGLKFSGIHLVIYSLILSGVFYYGNPL